MSGAEKKSIFLRKIKITLSKVINNVINSNCKKSSNLLIIKKCTFF